MIKVRDILNYALIFFVVYTTGSPYCVSFHYSTFITLLFITTAIVFFLARGVDRHLQSESLKKMLSLFTCMAIVIVINGVTNYSSYIAIAMQILAAYFVTRSIGYEEFKKKYINLISALALISLIAYFIALVYPTFVLNFPMVEGDYSSYYYNAGIHVFQAARGYDRLVVANRNSGIFWEPGAYQAFLNMGLAFILSTADVKNKGRKALFLILAIVTTASTTGYIVLAFLCIIYRKQLLNMIGGNNKTATLLGVIVAVCFLFYTSSVSSLSGFEKLINEFTSGHYLERLFLDDLKIIFQGMFNFLGISYETYEAMGLGSGNSIVQTMVTLGVPFAATLLKMYYDYAKRSERKGVFLIVLICIFFTESLLWRPFFLCLAWYGSKSFRTKKKLQLGGQE